MGASAKTQAVTNSGNNLYATKRYIERRFNDKKVEKDLESTAYKNVKASIGDAWFEAQGKIYSQC